MCKASEFAKQEARELLGQIKQCVDPMPKESGVDFAPTAIRTYGVKVPQLRQVAKAWYRAHKGIDQPRLFGLVRTLWDSGSREERSLVFYLLEHWAKWVPDLVQDDFDHWRRGLDSWTETDGLSWMLALWLAGAPHERLPYLRELIGDDDVWSRRLALVPLARINRGKLGFTAPDLTWELIDRVKHERHPMITKAISWVLRETTKTHRQEVIDYLDRNRDVLAHHVVREVENKLRTGLKSGKRRKRKTAQ